MSDIHRLLSAYSRDRPLTDTIRTIDKALTRYEHRIEQLRNRTRDLEQALHQLEDRVTTLEQATP